MEEAEPQVVQEQARHIPPQIQVPADHIAHEGCPVEGAAHRVAGKRREPRRIELVAQIVECMVVLEHRLLVVRRDRDLVREAPAHDGRVVRVLDDELFHLRAGIPVAVGKMLGDVGNLCPRDKTVLIA